MIPALLAASALAPIAGGIVGSIMDNGDEDASKQAYAEALRQWASLNAPSIEEQKIFLEKLGAQPDLTPEMEAYIQAEASRMEGVSADPRLKEAQMKALEQMQSAGITGLNAEDKYALNKASAQTARDARGRDSAILQNMAMRGMAGGGQELAARMMASQNATQNQAEESDRVAAMAMRRALESRAQAGTMAGQMRTEDFNEKSSVARAQDEINRFNTQNRINTQQRNVGARNAAQEYNLNRSYDVEKNNVAIANRQEDHNKGLYQTHFQNQLDIARGRSGAYNTEGGRRDDSAARTRNMWSGIGRGVGRGLSALANDSTSEDDGEYGGGGGKGSNTMYGG